jgi:hypothetical protein
MPVISKQCGFYYIDPWPAMPWNAMQERPNSKTNLGKAKFKKNEGIK